jgi:hypothetical protein
VRLAAHVDGVGDEDGRAGGGATPARARGLGGVPVRRRSG